MIPTADMYGHKEFTAKLAVVTRIHTKYTGTAHFSGMLTGITHLPVIIHTVKIQTHWYIYVSDQYVSHYPFDWYFF